MRGYIVRAALAVSTFFPYNPADQAFWRFDIVTTLLISEDCHKLFVWWDNSSLCKIWLIYDLLFFVLWIIPFDIIVFIFKKLSVLYVKSHYLEFEEETDEEIEQDIADDPEDHNDNIPYAEESDFEDDTIYTEERKPIPKIIPKKKKAPFNVEAFAKECNAYVVKQERQEEQENLQH